MTHAPALHACPGMHALHAPPPVPHAARSVPAWHAPLAQQPLQDIVSQVQAPATQRRPAPHVPCAHLPPHPSSAPQAFPVQLGVHVAPQPDPGMQVLAQPSGAPQALPAQAGVHTPGPHTFGPPPPQVPVAHLPQSTGTPQWAFISPQCPAQSAPGVEMQPASPDEEEPLLPGPAPESAALPAPASEPSPAIELELAPLHAAAKTIAAAAASGRPKPVSMPR